MSAQVDWRVADPGFKAYLKKNTLWEEMMEIFILTAVGLAMLVCLRWQIASAASKN